MQITGSIDLDENDKVGAGGMLFLLEIMQITGDQIDDFKSLRKDVAPPLPLVFRLLPILFYLSLVFLAVIGTLALWHNKVASDRLQEAQQRVATVKQEIASTKATRAALEQEIRRATDLESWVYASMPLQPLVVAIIRSIGANASIVDLAVERDPQTPSSLKFSLRLNTESDKQLEDTLAVIREMNYREISPTQTRVRGDLSYRASLLWQKPDKEENETPTSRAEKPVQP